MSILAWIIFGLIAGAVAQLLLPGGDPGGRSLTGIIITVLIGIVGAFVGGLIGAGLGFGGVNDFDIRSMLIAILGAIVVLVAYRLLTRQSVHA